MLMRDTPLGDRAFSLPIALSAFSYKKGQEIYGEGEPARYIYQVRHGAVRRYKLLSDGRRQIGAFHLVGDIFGLENSDAHHLTAEAVVATEVVLIQRESLEALAGTDAPVYRKLLDMTTRNLQHAENHMLLLGRKSATEKIAAFLLEMDERLTKAGIMALPMGRRDIADYLGVAHETVTRMLSILRDEGVLDFIGNTQREIVIRDRQWLASRDQPN
ncbi:helix-turn-helix domain-containing protein [Bradyrhizobium sp. Pa8]|uniref:helix-turn-helix domain-containing protein n=1 Tax=Bradyrhizobium sp. Pa8 TaxID=3386552 RepID=UPI00403F6A90